MRALDNYNRQRDKKLCVTVGRCMKSLGVCYFVIITGWFFLTLVSNGYREGLFKACFLPMLVRPLGGCSRNDALTRANTIRRRFAETVFTDAGGEEHQFTISLGVAEYNQPWDTASEFFSQADQALYQAKNTGKNRVCVS